MTFIIAALLVLVGAPRSFLLNGSADKIVACTEDPGTLAFAEAMENWNDDRLTGSFTLASAVISPHPSPVPSSVISRTSTESNSIKENSRIYKLNSTFLI
jgi:hypothetical protein